MPEAMPYIDDGTEGRSSKSVVVNKETFSDEWGMGYYAAINTRRPKSPVALRPKLPVIRQLTTAMLIASSSVSGTQAETLPPVNKSVIVDLDSVRQQQPPQRAHFEEAQSELVSYLGLEEGWDGEGTFPPARSAVFNALTFIDRLPVSAVAPETTVSPDGWVGVYWRNPQNAISVAFNGEGEIAYFAKLNGEVVSRGTGEFAGMVPHDLFEAICKI